MLFTYHSTNTITLIEPFNMRLTLLLLVLCFIKCASSFTTTTRANTFVAPKSTINSRLHASALIIQNKGGGHGELGYQLAKKIINDKDTNNIDSITILQDSSCKETQEPFKSYASELPDVNVIKAKLSDETMTQSDLQAILGGDDVKFDYVWDNASKEPIGAGKACADCAKEWKSQLYVYVSSAGIYQPTSDTTFPMSELTTPVKASAGQVAFENYCTNDINLPFVSFRPQYIYGEKANKFDYLDYFFDRIVRELPVPIPGDGTQLVSLTNSRDVASLLVSPLNDISAAIEQRIFNCGTDQLVSYNDVAKMCSTVAGMDGTMIIEHYDADLFGKTEFPFRTTNFYVDPSTAKRVLRWSGSEYDLKSDLVWYFENYKERGGPTKTMSFIKDWEICVGSKTSPQGYVGSIYDKYDPLIIDTTNVRN